ncbi:MAG: ribosomal L7Ae/L30e/S12e/Gadd45 family protein [Candidatus Caldarchaeum sp.]|nr:ribosomal L7Ae/L30e/S12e/Gadd45 family protein [Candidatus Caldarchaeum sp.]
MDLKQSLQVVSRTGSYVVGFKEALKKIEDKKALVVVASKRTDPVLISKLQVFAKAMDVPVLLTDLTPSDLGLSLRKPFPTSFIAVLDPGSSDIVDKARSENRWERE